MSETTASVSLEELVKGLSVDECDSLRKALGVSEEVVESGVFTASELDEAIEELQKGMGHADADWDEVEEAAQIDVTGFLSEVVGTLSKGMGNVHDAQDVLAAGMATVCEAVRGLASENAELRSEVEAMQKGLRSPAIERGFDSDLAVIEPLGSGDGLWSVGDASARMLKAMETTDDPARREQLSKAISAVECGGIINEESWRALGIQ